MRLPANLPGSQGVFRRDGHPHTDGRPMDEWGEGSIGYPNAQFGFGILESVRDTFGVGPRECWPCNYAPEDVGLGPYPTPDAALSGTFVVDGTQSHTVDLGAQTVGGPEKSDLIFDN